MNEDKRRYQETSECDLISPHNSLQVSRELEHLPDHHTTSSRKALFNSFRSYSSKFKISCLKVPLTDGKVEDMIQRDQSKSFCFIMCNNEGEFKSNNLYALLDDLESGSAKNEKEAIREHFNELFPYNSVSSKQKIHIIYALLNKHVLTGSLCFKLNINFNFLPYDLSRLLDQILLKLSGHLCLRKYNIHRRLNDHNLCKSLKGISHNVDFSLKEFENRSQDGMDLFKIIVHAESNLLELNVLTNSNWFNTCKCQSENKITVDATSKQDGNTKLDDEELSSLAVTSRSYLPVENKRELPFNSLLKYPFYLIHIINCRNKFENSSRTVKYSKTCLSTYSATQLGDSFDQNTNRKPSIVVLNDFQELYSVLMADRHSKQIDCKQMKTLTYQSYCSQLHDTWLYKMSQQLKSCSSLQNIIKKQKFSETCLTKYSHCSSFGKRDRASEDRNLLKGDNNNSNNNNNNKNKNEDNKKNRSKTLPDIIYQNGKLDKIFQHKYIQKSCTGRVLGRHKPVMHHLCQWNSCMHIQFAVKTTEAVMHDLENQIQMKDVHQILFFEDEAVKKPTSEFKKKTYAEDNMLTDQLRDRLQPDEKFSSKTLGDEENKAAMHVGTVSKTDDEVIEGKSKQKISTTEDKKRMTADTLLDKTQPEKLRLASETDDALQKKNGKIRSSEFDQAELHESHYTDTQLRAASGFGVQMRIGEETGENGGGLLDTRRQNQREKAKHSKTTPKKVYGTSKDDDKDGDDDDKKRATGTRKSADIPKQHDEGLRYEISPDKPDRMLFSDNSDTISPEFYDPNEVKTSAMPDTHSEMTLTWVGEDTSKHGKRILDEFEKVSKYPETPSPVEVTHAKVAGHKKTSSPDYLTQVTSEGLSGYWEKSVDGVKIPSTADHLAQSHDQLSYKADGKYKSTSVSVDESKDRDLSTHDISGKKATVSGRYDKKSPQFRKTLASDNLSETSLQGTLGSAEKTSSAAAGAAAYEKSKAHEASEDLPCESKHETASGSLNDLDNSFSEFLKLTQGFDKSHTVFIKSDDIQGYPSYLDYQTGEQISKIDSITDRKEITSPIDDGKMYAGRLSAKLTSLSLDKDYSVEVEDSSKLHTYDQLKKASMADSRFDDRREIMTEHLEYERKQLPGHRQFETIEPLNKTAGIFEYLPMNAYELTPNAIESLAFDISMIEGIQESTTLPITKHMKKYDAKDFSKISTTKFYELQQDTYSSHMKQKEDMPSHLLLLSDDYTAECFSDTDLLVDIKKQAKSTKPKRHTIQHTGVRRKRPERRLIPCAHKIPLQLDMQTRAHLRRKIKHCRKKIIAKHLDLYKRQQKLLTHRFDYEYYSLNHEKNKELAKEIEEMQKVVNDSSQKLRDNYISSPYNADYMSTEISKSNGLTPERLAALGCFILPNSINQPVNPQWYEVIRHQLMEPHQPMNSFIKFPGGQYCQPLKKTEQIHADFLKNSTNVQQFFSFTKPKSLTQLYNNKEEKSLSLSEDKSLSSGSIRRRRRCSSTSSGRRMIINTNHQLDDGQYGIRSLNNCALLSSKDYLRSLLSSKKISQRKLNNSRRNATTSSTTKHLHPLRPYEEFDSLENLYTLKARIYSLIDCEEEGVQTCGVDAVTFTKDRQHIIPVLEKCVKIMRSENSSQLKLLTFRVMSKYDRGNEILSDYS
ncbi:unnamed protein product [Trichobilharzia szidati]|nr:unnamed protein product [Trichobilharzia szidati]